MTGAFDAANEDHLAALLEAAKANLEAKTPLGTRTAAHLIIDYYQAILYEAGKKVGRDFQGVAIPARVSLLRASVGGLEIGVVEGLEKIRNLVYHNENRLPGRDTLQRYLEEAPKVRAILQKATDDAVDHEKVMARGVQRLKASAQELPRQLQHLRKDLRPKWEAACARAIALADANPKVLSDEGFDLLLDIQNEIASIRTADEIIGFNIPPDPEPEDEDYDPREYEPDYEPEPDDYEAEDHPEPDYDPSDFYPDSGADEGPSDDGEQSHEPEPDFDSSSEEYDEAQQEEEADHDAPERDEPEHDEPEHDEEPDRE